MKLEELQVYQLAMDIGEKVWGRRVSETMSQFRD
jgi:hypothetical protein